MKLARATPPLECSRCGLRIIGMGNIGGRCRNTAACNRRHRDALLTALRNMVAASDQFVRETGLKHGDLITDATDKARAGCAE